MHAEIIVVSGLPRSGTSLMMQMLDQGGIEIVTDGLRAADTDNPRGYYELEAVKKIKQDASWLPKARGKAFKMVSQLLYDLPAGESYRIIFMERDVQEMLESQEKMLRRLGREPAPREQIKRAYTLHLEKLHAWLHGRANLAILRVNYNALVQQPLEEAERVAGFLAGRVDAMSMVRAVDAGLYRNRQAVVGRSGA
jgi:hypothetical protein